MFASLDFKVKLPQREHNKQKQLSECFLLYSQPPRQFIQRENKFLSRKAKWVINSRTPGRKNKSWLRVILLKLTEMCSNTSGFDSKKTPVSSPGQRSPTGIYAAGWCVCVCACLERNTSVHRVKAPDQNILCEILSYLLDEEIQITLSSLLEKQDTAAHRAAT